MRRRAWSGALCQVTFRRAVSALCLAAWGRQPCRPPPCERTHDESSMQIARVSPQQRKQFPVFGQYVTYDGPNLIPPRQRTATRRCAGHMLPPKRHRETTMTYPECARLSSPVRSPSAIHATKNNSLALRQLPDRERACPFSAWTPRRRPLLLICVTAFAMPRVMYLGYF